MRRLTTGCALLVTVGLMLGTGRAEASIQINIGNSGLSGVNGPFATVTLTQNGTDVDVVVQALNSSSFGTNVDVARLSDFGFDMAGSPTVQNVTAGWTYEPNGDQFDGFGNFDHAFTTGSSAGARQTQLSFTVDNVSVAAFGASFAVHWYSNTGTGQTQATGFATNGVPEPGPLLGAGVVTLMGLGYTWRRRRHATA